MALFARRVAHLVEVDRVVDPDGATCLYSVTGELFFASDQELIDAFDYAGDPPRVIIDLSRAHIWDASAVAALDAIEGPLPPPRRRARDHRPQRAQRRAPPDPLRPADGDPLSAGRAAPPAAVLGAAYSDCVELPGRAPTRFCGGRPASRAAGAAPARRRARREGARSRVGPRPRRAGASPSCQVSAAASSTAPPAPAAAGPPARSRAPGRSWARGRSRSAKTAGTSTSPPRAATRSRSSSATGKTGALIQLGGRRGCVSAKGKRRLRQGGRAGRPELGRAQPRRPLPLRDLARRQLRHRLPSQHHDRRAHPARAGQRLRLRRPDPGLRRRPRPGRP